jgi:nicotinamidase-related amidase
MPVALSSSSKRGIEKIIVVGGLANTCVEATARCSAELGFT